MTLDIEKLKQSAEHFKLNDCPLLVNPLSLLELITLLKETQADLSHANSILIKIEKLLEGVEYRGDFAEGVRVLKDSLEVAEKKIAKWNPPLGYNPDYPWRPMYFGDRCSACFENFDLNHKCGNCGSGYAAMKEKP